MKQKQALILTLKVAAGLSALGFVLYQVEFQVIWTIVTEQPIFNLFFCFLAFCFSQLLSGLRLYAYLSNENFKITNKQAVVLYFKGLFFLIFIPGGLGGDAYVAYHLRDKYGSIQKSDPNSTGQGKWPFSLDIDFINFSDLVQYLPCTHTDTMIATSSLLVLAVYHFSTKFCVVRS